MDVVVPGTEPIQADLVFVHGLRGDRIKTWESDKVFWPRDLLPKELPNVRIMSYGYDANVMNFFSNVSQSSIFQHSTNLLENLQRKRRREEEKKRPVIFIGHSLGGLVIKDALCKSNHYRDNPHHQRTAAIYRSTYGIVFLGTPHRGGNHTAWASIATNFATTVLKDHNSKVVDALKRGSETLERIQDSFCNIVGQMHIWSFFEDLGYGAAGKIVDDDSATLGLPSERKEWIRANHSDICKFSNEDDYGYISVSGGISELVEDAVVAAAAGSGAMHQEQASLLTRVKPVPPVTSISMTKTADSQAQTETPHYTTAQVPSSINRNTAPPTSVQAQFSNHSRSFPGPTYAKSIPSQYHKADDDAFIRACEDNDVETARRLLGSGTSPDTVSRDGDPALWFAYESYDDKSGRPVFRLLLEFKADPDAKNKAGQTLLMATAREGEVADTKTLLQYGADPNASDSHRCTPLMYSAWRSSVVVVHALLQAGADVHASDKDGQTPLMYAAREGDVDVILALHGAGADVKASDRHGYTSLLCAAMYGHVDIVQALLEAGADVNVEDREGKTALRYMVHEGITKTPNGQEVMKILLAAGARA